MTSKCFIFIDKNHNSILKNLDEVINDFELIYKHQIPINCKYTLKTTKWSRICKDENWDENEIFEDNRIYVKTFTKNLDNFWIPINKEDEDYLISFYEYRPGGDYIVFALKDLLSYEYCNIE